MLKVNVPRHLRIVHRTYPKKIALLLFHSHLTSGGQCFQQSRLHSRFIKYQRVRRDFEEALEKSLLPICSRWFCSSRLVRPVLRTSRSLHLRSRLTLYRTAICRLDRSRRNDSVVGCNACFGRGWRYFILNTPDGGNGCLRDVKIF